MFVSREHSNPPMRTLLKNFNSAPKFWILLIFFLLSNSFAQIYDTPESRKILEAEKASKEAQLVKSISEPSFEEKEYEAISYLGKTFRFIPGTRPLDPVRFYQEIPPSSRSLDPKIIFRPLIEVEFSVTGLLMPPPKVFLPGQDDFLLRIVFRDGKDGYVNIHGCCGILAGQKASPTEKTEDRVAISSEPTTELVTKLTHEYSMQKEEQRRLELAEQQENERKKKAEVERTERELKKAELEFRKAEELRKAQQKKPYPSIGLTKEEVIHKTNWGRPLDVNRTITSKRTMEQWVYGGRRYLYFENGILTAIQD